MKIEEWFDPTDIEHIRAYVHLESTGCWPQDFIPADVEFNPPWQIRLTAKMAHFWKEHMIACEEEADNDVEPDETIEEEEHEDIVNETEDEGDYSADFKYGDIIKFGESLFFVMDNQGEFGTVREYDKSEQKLGETIEDFQWEMMGERAIIYG